MLSWVVTFLVVALIAGIVNDAFADFGEPKQT